MSERLIMLTAGALLIILLTGAWMLDRPETTTSELVQGLDMRGNWEGSFYDSKGIAYNCRFEYEYSPIRRDGLQCFRGSVWAKEKGYIEMEITDEGKGCLKVARETGTTLGIYKQDDSKLVICYSHRGESRPTSLRNTKNQHLLILRRVIKSEKKGK